jgi:carbonic anhydrase
MEYLYEGFKKYQSNSFENNKNLLKELAGGQAPKTLLLTCSDSRISVNDFTETKPGEVFVVRNAGNVIANYDVESPTNEALTLEYGVQALGVKEIIVCGHAYCGAVTGIKNLGTLDAVPLVQKGLTRISKQFSVDELKNFDVPDLIISNVKKQLNHLYSYPFVKEKFDQGELQVWGWVYDFENGELSSKFSLAELLKNGEV